MSSNTHLNASSTTTQLQSNTSFTNKPQQMQQVLATSASIPTLSTRLKVKPNAGLAEASKSSQNTSIIQKGTTKPSRIGRMIPKSTPNERRLDAKENEPMQT